jgi:hypothetical protein
MSLTADSSTVQSKSFVGAVFSAIKALAMLIIDLVGVAQEGVAMADKAVKCAREKQGVELALNMSDYATLTITKAAVEQTKAMEALQEYIGNDANRKQLVNGNVERLTTIVNQELASIRTSRNG